MNFLTQIKASFTNFDEYRAFASQKTKTTLKYLTLLFTILFVVGGLPSLPSLNPSKAVSDAKETIPDFKLADGKLAVYGKQPITIGDSSQKIIIDTTGKTDDSALNNTTKSVLVTADRIIVKQEMQTQTFELSEFKDTVLTKQSLLDLIPKFMFAGLAFAVIFGYLFGWLSLIITAVALALIGMAINAVKKGKLEFGALWNAAVYALTLPWVIETVKNMIYPELPLFGLVKWGLAIYLIYRGIEAANTPLASDSPADA